MNLYLITLEDKSQTWKSKPIEKYIVAEDPAVAEELVKDHFDQLHRKVTNIEIVARNIKIQGKE